jgi:hypothetical protein
LPLTPCPGAPTRRQEGTAGLTGRSCSENRPPRSQASTRIGRISRVLAEFGEDTDRHIVTSPCLIRTGSAPAASVHSAALHQLANRLVGMLQGCVTASARYDETTAWSHHLAPLDIQAHGCLTTAGSAASGPSDQPTPTGRPDNGTSPGSPHVRRPFTCPPSSNSTYVTRCMVIGSLVGATLSYPGILSGAVCRPREVVSCTSRFPSTSTEVVSPCMSGQASSKRLKRSIYPSGPVEVLWRVVHQHDVRAEMTGNLAVVAPIPCC